MKKQNAKPSGAKIMPAINQVYLRDAMPQLGINRCTYDKKPELRAYLREEKLGNGKIAVDRERVNAYLMMIKGKITAKQACKRIDATPKWLWSRRKVRKLLGETNVFGMRFYSADKVELYRKLYLCA